MFQQASHYLKDCEVSMMECVCKGGREREKGGVREREREKWGGREREDISSLRWSQQKKIVILCTFGV
jgi:hypothetical protein